MKTIKPEPRHGWRLLGGRSPEIKINTFKNSNAQKITLKDSKVMEGMQLEISKASITIYYFKENYKKLCKKRITSAVLVCLHHILEADLSTPSWRIMRISGYLASRNF